MKKKIKPSVIVFWIIILVIVSVVIYTFFIASEKDILEKNPYTNTEYGWSINYPSGWKISEGVFGDADFIDKNSDDIFLNIRVEPLTSYMSTSLEEEVEIMQKILENDSIISQRNRSVNNMNAYEFIYKYEEESSWIKVKLILIEKDEKVFKIIYNSGINSYNKYESLAEKCISTFKIL